MFNKYFTLSEALSPIDKLEKKIIFSHYKATINDTSLFIIAPTMWQSVKQSLEDIDLGDLRVNQAFLNITSHLPDRLWMYTLSEDCIRVS